MTEDSIGVETHPLLRHGLTITDEVLEAIHMAIREPEEISLAMVGEAHGEAVRARVAALMDGERVTRGVREVGRG